MIIMANMKKMIVIVIVGLLFSLAGCGGGQGAASPAEGPSGPAAVDPDDYAVDLTIPAAFFEGDDGEDGLRPGDDLEDYIRENGFLDAHWDIGGSLTVTMTVQRFHVFKQTMIENTNLALSDLVEDEALPFVVGYEAAEEFKTVTILVDREGFEGGGMKADFLPMYVGVTVGMYRGFVGEDGFYSVIIADAATGVVIERLDFPLEE